MKVLILGGTGMLGYPTALEFLKRGDEVEVTARSVPQLGPEYDQQVKVHTLDVSRADEADLLAVMQGVDALVYALGPDDREAPPAPAEEFFKVNLVEQTEQVMQAARKAGVKRAVILGSYFCTFNRLHPEWRLAQRHPYIRGRVVQAMRAMAAGDTPNGLPRMAVMVLEIPYVFGVTPGRPPFWKDVFFERLRKMKVVMYPRGGSATVTTQQVAEAVVGAVLRGEHGQSYPVADMNMDWNTMITAFS